MTRAAERSAPVLHAPDRGAARPAASWSSNGRPIRVLELRSALGHGGGPEKTILLGAARAEKERFAVTVCYIRDARDAAFGVGELAAALPVDYVEVIERHSFDPRIFPALRRIVRERAIDIVHAHDYKTDLIAVALARLEGVRPIATAHLWIEGTWRERLYNFLDRRILSRYPLVIAVSEPIRQAILRCGARPERVVKVLNGVDHARFRPEPGARGPARAALGIAAGAVAIGAVCRLAPEKRLDLLLEAAARLDGVRRPIVAIAGDGPARDALAARAAALGLGDRVRLLGHRSDPAEVHRALDVYVQSSEDEGVPNTVLEAMAVGTPVVATDVGGTREVLADGRHGLLVPSGDAAALARAIERTLADPAATAGRVAAARERIERELSFETRMRKVEALYERLVATGPRRRPSAPRLRDPEDARP